MTPAVPKHSPEEVARLGDEIYARVVQPRLTPDDHGKYVAIDIATEEYEVDVNEWDAIARLRGRGSVPQIWLLRVGQPVRLSYRMRFGQ